MPIRPSGGAGAPLEGDEIGFRVMWLEAGRPQILSGSLFFLAIVWVHGSPTGWWKTRWAEEGRPHGHGLDRGWCLLYGRCLELNPIGSPGIMIWEQGFPMSVIRMDM